MNSSPMTISTRRHVLRIACAGLAGSALPWHALAQSTWPAKPVTLVVPFPPGVARTRLPARCRPSSPN